MKGKVLFLSAITAFYATAFGATVTIPSVYDEATDTWTGDVTALTNAIKNITAYSTIYLSKGVYDLSPVTNAPMYSAGGGGYGAALICAMKSGVKFVGITGDPADVIIKAIDSDYRLLCLNTQKSGAYNLTFTGGHAAEPHIATWRYRCGGAVLLSGSGTIVSNCVFYGNRAGKSGGAVATPITMGGTVHDSVFYDNNGSPEALAASHIIIRNCVFTNNIAETENSGEWSASVVAESRVYDSYFAHNRANRTGGISECVAVNCDFRFNTQGNQVANNWGNPGGGASYNSTLTNCTFYGNSAYRLGGAIRGGSAVNCTVISNMTRHVTDANGGGIFKASLVEGCTVSSNISRLGGGIYGGSCITNTTISYNCANTGGGAYSSPLTDCSVAHNVAKDYGNGNYGGAGGGIAYGAATNCVFRDNSCSSTYAAENLKSCDIADTSMHATVVDSCVIHGMKNVSMPRAIGNVSYPDGFVTSNIYMIGGVQLMRNCLITNCTWRSIPGSYVNAAMFEPAYSAISTRVENCSIVDNYYYLFARNYNSDAKTISVVNTVAHNALTSTRPDISRLSAKYLVLSNCVYGTYETGATAEGFEDHGCMQLKDRSAYKFTGLDSAPHSLRRSSPLRGWGLVLDWMADGTDFPGNPRLRDGKVDIGCYQCWLNPVGTIFSVR